MPQVSGDPAGASSGRRASEPTAALPHADRAGAGGTRPGHGRLEAAAAQYDNIEVVFADAAQDNAIGAITRALFASGGVAMGVAFVATALHSLRAATSNPASTS